MSEESSAPPVTDPAPVAPPTPRRGYLNARLVNGFALAIIAVCILAGVTASIMAIWDYADKDTLLRTIATVGVITLGTILFAGINRALGD